MVAFTKTFEFTRFQQNIQDGCNINFDDIAGYVNDRNSGTVAWDVVNAAVFQRNGVPLIPIMQVVSATFAGSSTATTGYADVTGATVSITPTKATSKILILCHSHFAQSAVNGRGTYTLLRGTTDLGGTSGMAIIQQANGQTVVPLTVAYLDSPAATTSTTYKFQIKSDAVTTTTFFGNFIGNLTNVIYAVELGI